MKDIKEKISIIMPAYNEAEHIRLSVEETIKTFDDFGCNWELIVIDDGSTDATPKILEELVPKYPGQLLVGTNPLNLGKGEAIKNALNLVSGDYVVFLDADLDLHPLQVQTLFDIMRLDNADIVIGSKLHPNSIVQYPLERKIASYVYYLMVKLMFNLPCHDTQTGLKLFKVDVLRSVFPKILVKKYAFDLEVLVVAHSLGFRIAEAPIVLTPQRKIYGRIGYNAAADTFRDTLAVLYRMRILKYYDRIDNHCGKKLAK